MDYLYKIILVEMVLCFGAWISFFPCEIRLGWADMGPFMVHFGRCMERGQLVPAHSNRRHAAI